jgi:hypothetical protein
MIRETQLHGSALYCAPSRANDLAPIGAVEAFAPVRILVVEDDDEMRRLLTRRLTKDGYVDVDDLRWVIGQIAPTVT